MVQIEKIQRILVEILAAVLILITVGAAHTQGVYADTVDVSSWTGLQSAINNAQKEAVIRITGDLTCGEGESCIMVDSGKSVTIDLNEKTLNRNLTSEKEDGHVFKVADGTTLIISTTIGDIDPKSSKKLRSSRHAPK